MLQGFLERTFIIVNMVQCLQREYFPEIFSLWPHLVCDEGLSALDVLVSVSMDILISLSPRLLTWHHCPSIAENVL